MHIEHTYLTKYIFHLFKRTVGFNEEKKEFYMIGKINLNFSMPGPSTRFPTDEVIADSLYSQRKLIF